MLAYILALSTAAFFQIDLSTTPSAPGISVVAREGLYPTGISAVVVGTDVCNTGSQPVPTCGVMQENHPGQLFNAYRLTQSANGVTRLEQIGSSWVFHEYSLIEFDNCGLGCVPTDDPELLGLGCSLDHGTAVMGSPFWLGPRREWDEHAGTWSCLGSWFDGQPADCIRDEDGSGVGAFEHRLVLHDADLAVPGASFWIEAIVISAGDSVPSNDVFTSAFTPINAGASVLFDVPPASTVFDFAVARWAKVLGVGSVPGDGQVWLGSEVTEVAVGSWRYEYALFNRSLEAKAAALELPHAGVATGAAFRDLDDESDNDWAPVIDADTVRFELPAGVPSNDDGFGGPLEFGVLYNFGFTSDSPPTTGSAVATTFSPGGTDAALDALVPDAATWVDLGHASAGPSVLTPALSGTGSLIPGTPAALHLANAPHSASVTLVAGLSVLGATLQGKLLVPTPDVIVPGLATNGSGQLDLPFIWPTGVPSGTTLVTQAWVTDGATYATSGGLLGTTP